MNDTASSAPQRTRAVAISLLVTASVALSLGFACAVPLAAFAAIASMLLPGASAFGAVLAVWLANQIVGFVWLNYPMDASTLAWGAVLGVIAVGCLGTARLARGHLQVPLSSGAAFLASFCVYEGGLYVACLVSGTDVSHFTPVVVTRIFLINAATFAGFLAMWVLVLRTEAGRRIDASLGLRHA